MSDINSFVIEPQTAESFTLTAGQKLKIIDIEGKQVADLIAVNANNRLEILSMGVTMDQNNSLRIRKDDFLFSNHYNEMFQVVEDLVGEHDLMHPMCNSYMFSKQYEKKVHSSCEENIRKSIAKRGIELTHVPVPLNVFMNTAIKPDGSIVVVEPKSKPGDFLILEACMNLVVAIAACSVEESRCNGFECTSIKIELLS